MEPEQRGTTTGDEELSIGLSNQTRGAPEQRGEEEKESRRGRMGRKNPRPKNEGANCRRSERRFLK